MNLTFSDNKSFEFDVIEFNSEFEFTINVLYSDVDSQYVHDSCIIPKKNAILTLEDDLFELRCCYVTAFNITPPLRIIFTVRFDYYLKSKLNDRILTYKINQMFKYKAT